MATHVSIVHHLVFHIEALLIGSRVQNSFHSETTARSRRADEIDDGFEIHQRLATPMRLMNEKSRCSILFHLLVPGG